MRSEAGRAASTGERVETPLLRIITRGATDQEIAALVAVVSALATAGAGAARPPAPEWSAPRRLVRAAYPHGPGGWRSSAMP